MKKAIVFFLLLAACAMPAHYSREEAASDMPRLNEIEKRSAGIVKIVNFFGGALKPETLARIKENLDFYFIHHEAATVALATSRREDFDRYVAEAQSELDQAESVLREELGI